MGSTNAALRGDGCPRSKKALVVAGELHSNQVAGWTGDIPRQRLSSTNAIVELGQRDPWGSIQLAGTAVGAAFVGTITACLAAA